MNLYKRVTTSIDGFEGLETTFDSFVISETKPKNDKPITQEDVVEADEVMLEYSTFHEVGPITDDEIAILMKFEIVKKHDFIK